MIFPWTEQAVSTLRRMIDEKKSARAIAKALGDGCTRNAVIGKAHRLGLGFSMKPNKSGVRSDHAFAKAKGRKPVIAKRLFTKPIELVEAKEPEAFAMPDDSFRVDLMGLGNSSCRWPLDRNEDGNWMFCGSPEADDLAGRSYCPYHAQRSRNAVQPTRAPRKDRDGYASPNTRLLDMEAA